MCHSSFAPLWVADDNVAEHDLFLQARTVRGYSPCNADDQNVLDIWKRTVHVCDEVGGWMTSNPWANCHHNPVTPYTPYVIAIVVTCPRCLSVAGFYMGRYFGKEKFLRSAARASLQSALASAASTIDFCDPYSVFDILLHEIVSLRQEEPDYGLLHEIARHAIHVSETLTVASGSAKDLHQQHEDFTSLYVKDSSQWRRHRSPLRFPQRILEALLARSESNKARLQTEIQLAFHTAAQRDSRIQVQIGEEARKETTAMKALAVITMTFLPATFISSVFSTPFFRYEDASEEARGHIAVSDQFWIYWALAGPLSVATFALWAFWDRTRARTGLARRVDDAGQKDKEASNSIIPWRHKLASIYRDV
ncbi:hypothetical protein SAPIO_CDS3989 [Scedosporium apiospermum]|uniref:Uncharacterized protein n=1 Tax=Pseudallescheria apiosperma TaxID=563466 RepID=A0A084G918_PSEDA|nr:uncharacterized protein SAPIO_CDS3989 [Scedosporium apiospermum]KEZ43830.1 hypothetical protein SAPIO_CDS3989 [Scedosporium apiospermum]